MSTQPGKRRLARLGLVLVALVPALLMLLSPDRDPLPPSAPDRDSLLAGVEPSDSASGDPGADRNAPSEVPTGPGRIHGVVRQSGMPVAARMTLRFIPGTTRDFSEIWLVDPANGSDIATTRADSEGRYHFPGIGPGFYEVEARTGEGSVGYQAVHLSRGYDRRRVDVDIPTGGHVLRGTARWADGRPYDGRVGLVDAEDGQQLYGAYGRPSAKTDRRGHFEIRRVPEGRYELCAGPADTFRSFSKEFDVPHVGPVRFILDEGLRTIPGRVVSSTTGRPIAGVTVLASGHLDDGLSVHERFVTGADGRFRARIPGVFLHLMGFSPGYCPLHEHFEDPDAPIEIRMDPVARVFGCVLSAGTGEPVAGAVVRWRPGGNRYHPGSGQTVSDAEGRYELTGVPAMEVHLYVRGGGWVSESMVPAEDGSLDPCVVPPDGSVERDLNVVAAGRALVRVRDADGRPVARAAVEAEHDGCWFSDHALESDEEEDLSGITGEDGTVLLDGLRPGVPYDVTVRADDGPPGLASEVRAFARQQVEVEVEMPRSRWIEVLVTDVTSGEPVEGVVVNIGPLEDEWRTDVRGIAFAGPFADREVDFTFRHPHYFRPKRSLKVPADCKSVQVELKCGAVVTGTVRFSGGGPGARAEVRALESEGGSVLVYVMAEEDGGFELRPLPEGEVHLEAVAWREETRFAAKLPVRAGRRDVALDLTESPLEENDDVDLPLVRVVGPDGLPVSRATAQLFEVSRFEDAIRLSRGWVKEGVLEGDGARWVLVHSAKGERLERLPLGTAFVGPIEDPDREILLQLPAERSIEGTLLDEGGRPVHGVRIRAVPVFTEFPMPLNREPMAHDEVRTAADGSFRLGRLGDREYRLEADLPGRFAEGPAPTARAGARKVTINLRPAARPLLTVLDAEGNPVPGARLKASSLSRDWTATVLTDADGRARLTGLDPDGSYGLALIPPKGRDDVVPLVLSDWRPAEETHRLPLPLTIRGVARREDGTTVYTRIFYQGVFDQRPRSVVSDGDGTFEITRLSPGTYRLRATDDGSEVPVPAGATDVVLICPK